MAAPPAELVTAEETPPQLPAVTPATPEHKTVEGREAQALHDRIRAQVSAIETGYMQLAADLAVAYAARIWEYFRDASGAAFAAPDPYFETFFGMKIRTVLRLKAIHEAVERLPEGERPAAVEALSQIGRHKAAVLVPVLGNSERPWREWVAEAGAGVSERALQAKVSMATGAKPRGPAAAMPDYGQEFMDRVIAGLSPTEQARCRAVWMAWNGLQGALTGKQSPTDPRAGLVLLFDKAQEELGFHGVEINVS